MTEDIDLPRVEDPALSAKGKEATTEQPKDDKVDKIEFFSGNPSVEVTNGVVHLFRDEKFDLHDHFSKPVSDLIVNSLLIV